MAAFMANKGKLGEQQLMSEASWDAMHADPTYEPLLLDGMGTFFTAGGLAHFDYEELKKQKLNEFFGRNERVRTAEFECHAKRKGYYGWFGAGGSIFQWNPTNQIGFGYVPSDFIEMDGANFRGSLLQDLASKCAAAVDQE